MIKKITFILSLLHIFSNFVNIANADIPTTPSTIPVQPKDDQSVTPTPTIEFLNPWARASLSPNNNSAVYLTIKNNSNAEFTLIGASAIEVANNVELHQSYVDEKGVSKMVAIDKIVIPAHSEIVLKPGGMHIMLFDLKRTLKPEYKFKMNLKFLTIGTKVVDVEVKSNNQ